MSILITGGAGFIGFHLAEYYLKQGETVLVLDNLNDYYEVSLKQARLQQLSGYANFHFYQQDLADAPALERLFQRHRPERVVNLAAQAGVRYSISNPSAYVQSNLLGFSQLIEACRQYQVQHLVYASSSSVYGANEKQPYMEADACNHPLSLYAATKKANELIAHSYSHLYQLPTTGLRFFTVYGPWGRPDMAFFSFTKNILRGEPIRVFNHGQMQRDFTYIDDIIAAMVLLLDKPAQAEQTWSAQNPDPASSSAPYRIYNIGSGKAVQLLDYIRCIEQATGKQAILQFEDRQDGDVLSTLADNQRLAQEFGYAPRIEVAEGISRFVAWYRDYYQDSLVGNQNIEQPLEPLAF